jgi:hypothetical protein
MRPYRWGVRVPRSDEWAGGDAAGGARAVMFPAAERRSTRSLGWSEAEPQDAFAF